MQRTLLSLAVFTFVLCNAAFAADQATVEEWLAVAKKVVAATPDGDKRWNVLPNGVVRHNNSGMVCGAMVGEMPLVELRSLPGSPVPDGSVDCRYSNSEVSAGYDVYAFSSGKVLSGEDAFNAHRQALMTGPGNPVSIATFPVVNIPDAKGEAFLVTANGVRRFTYLCVGVVHEWVVSVRFTTAPQPDFGEKETKGIVLTISNFPQALAYRALRGVAAKQLNMSDPKDGF